MQISSIGKSSFSFGIKYPTENILAFTTHYPYKNRMVHQPMVKELTGIDMTSDEFCSSIPKNCEENIYKISLVNICVQRILSQNKELADADDTFVSEPIGKGTNERQEAWFAAQVKKLGKKIDIQPFSVSNDEIKKEYDEFMDLIEYVHRKC